MYKFVAVFALIAIVYGAPVEHGADVEILKSVSDVTPDGGYTWSFEAADGSGREETGVPMNVGKEDQYFAVTGTYKYIDVEGKPIEVHYTADAHGFVPSGGNIPESIVNAVRHVADLKV